VKIFLNQIVIVLKQIHNYGEIDRQIQDQNYRKIGCLVQMSNSSKKSMREYRIIKINTNRIRFSKTMNQCYRIKRMAISIRNKK
jgi:hypothetical protein